MQPSIGDKNHFLPLCVSGGFWQSWSHVWMQVWVCCVYPKRSLTVYFLQINLSWYLYQPFLHISVLIYLHMCIALVCKLVIMFPWMFVCKDFCPYIVRHVFIKVLQCTHYLSEPSEISNNYFMLHLSVQVCLCTSTCTCPAVCFTWCNHCRLQ